MPPTAVEIQLRQHFEQVFANAQFSPEYTCLARELARFREEHDALPDELLEQGMAGRCQTPSAGYWKSTLLHSDGTILDTPLSPEVLAGLTKQLVEGLPPFDAFGITARYMGPHALVLLETAELEASMRVGAPGENGSVRVEGKLFREFTSVSAVINQGEFGTRRCESDPAVALPDYALTCMLADGDDEAWIGLTASNEGSWPRSLAYLPARARGWTPPAEYRRARSNVPSGHDASGTLLGYVNDARTALGLHPLLLAREQSALIQPLYERLFEVNAAGNWTDDTHLRAELLVGSAVQGDVWWGHLTAGIAYDGNVTDWIDYQMLVPVFREVLMAPLADQLAIATHASPSLGFGAAAVTYFLFTPEREELLARSIAERIVELRGKRGTHRLQNLPELEVARDDVASGTTAPEIAFQAALSRVNVASKGGGYLKGLLLELPTELLEFKLPDALLQVDELEFGLIVTHHKYRKDQWARPIAFLWFIDEPASGRGAARKTRLGTGSRG